MSTMNRRRMLTAIVMLLGVHRVIDDAAALTFAPRQESAAPSAPGHRLTLPAIAVRRPSNLPTHQASRDAVLARAAATQAQVANETSPQRAAQRLLAAANAVLAYGPVESAGAMFYGAAADSDRADLAECTARARDYIRQAKDAVQLASRSPDGAPDWAGAIGRDADLLSIWADVFDVLSRSPSAETDAQCNPILARLAILLESDRDDVVACAGLWSLPLTRTPEHRAALLRELPLPLSEPDVQSQPWGVLLRVKRCEAEAQQGRWASASALLIQQRESMGAKWLGNSDVPLFKHSAGWFQGRVLQMWDDTFTKAEQTDERGWCDEQINRLKKDVFGTEPVPLLPVFPLVPMQSQVPPGSE